jgi:hypothetical protein
MKRGEIILEDYFDIQFPEEKMICAVINGEEYTFKALFSFRDYEIVIGELEKEDCKYRNIVAEVVLNHACNGNIEILTALSLPERLLLHYIDEVVKDSKRISVIYEDKADISDVYERFIVSVKENLNNEIGAIKESVANIKIPQISISRWYFQQSTLNLSKEIFDKKFFVTYKRFIAERLSQIARSTINTQNIVESFQPIIEMQQSFVAQIAKQAAQTLTQLPSFFYTEEKMEKMRSAFCKWGEYGWTLPKCAKMSEFMIEPVSVKDANNIASKYCKKEYIQKLFEDIKEIGSVRKSDFNEAVDDYKDKRYKSCACILFSLIDAKLIRMQTEKKQGKLVNRSVGKVAVEKSKENLLSNSNIENTLFSILILENVYSCLMKFFESGKNFEKQPEVMNRNFLVHGMLTRRVTKRDCDQLFLLYYNWLSLLEKC